MISRGRLRLTVRSLEVTSFKYVGAIVSDEDSKPEVISRIAQATAALTKLNQYGEITTYLLDQR